MSTWTFFIVDHSGVKEASPKKPLLTWSIAFRELSVRSQNTLARGEVRSWDELAQHDERSLRDIRNCGETSANEIVAWSHKHGVMI